jgi:hydroxymethylglutaryl-CoA synthase
MKVGISAIQFSFPKLYLSIETLAKNRNIEPEKLTKGLGLQKMSLLDTNQDIITLATNAVLNLLKQENLNLNQINRIYLATESSLDQSKPMASYVLQLLTSHLKQQNTNCDVVDMTFACIGGIDALQNCNDFITLNPTKKAIVVTTDFAKYDLKSTGEYTQGAGAIALLITSDPKIISFETQTGISTEGVFDFFKPKQYLEKEKITQNQDNTAWEGFLENQLTYIKDQPVFDGQYSNQCYINRITEAFNHFKSENNFSHDVIENWDLICMHLPYCFQGRRTFVEIFANENQNLLIEQVGENIAEKTKSLAKSETYKKLVNQKIYPSEISSSEIGNIYTGSIFLGFLSALYHTAKNQSLLKNNKVGFIAYGSGSKSKVFEGLLVANWQNEILKTNLFETLEKRTEIDFETYEKLHKKELKISISKNENEFILSNIETENPVLKGARYYEYKG